MRHFKIKKETGALIKETASFSSDLLSFSAKSIRIRSKARNFWKIVVFPQNKNRRDGENILESLSRIEYYLEKIKDNCFVNVRPRGCD